jgi:intracellular septation protein
VTVEFGVGKGYVRPMPERRVHPLIKLALEVGPIAVFFLAYRMAPVPEGLGTAERQLEQILFATAVFVPTILVALGLSYALTRKLPRMAVITAVVVTIFGGLTLILRDDTFVKMKPTILYSLFAGILGFGLLRGQSYLKYLMDELIPMQQEGWIKFTVRFVVFYLFLAVLNEVVWRGWGTDAWVNFRTFVLPAANFGFIMAQVPLFQRYALQEGSGRRP